MKTEKENSKIENQKSEQTDSLNIEKVKVNLKKGKADLLTKESVSSKKEIYKGTEGMNSEEQKKFRSKIRRSVNQFVNQILGKDRSDSEREKAISEFLKFYKKNFRIVDFKIENFSQSKNEANVKDYIQLLNYVQSTLEN